MSPLDSCSTLTPQADALRDISALDISQVLEDYETRRLARRLPHLDYRSEIFVGMVRGRRLRVYVMQGSDPPYIMTVA